MVARPTGRNWVRADRFGGRHKAFFRCLEPANGTVQGGRHAHEKSPSAQSSRGQRTPTVGRGDARVRYPSKRCAPARRSMPSVRLEGRWATCLHREHEKAPAHAGLGLADPLQGGARGSRAGARTRLTGFPAWRSTGGVRGMLGRTVPVPETVGTTAGRETQRAIISLPETCPCRRGAGTHIQFMPARSSADGTGREASANFAL
jgi:hypothetical protein